MIFWMTIGRSGQQVLKDATFGPLVLPSGSAILNDSCAAFFLRYDALCSAPKSIVKSPGSKRIGCDRLTRGHCRKELASKHTPSAGSCNHIQSHSCRSPISNELISSPRMSLPRIPVAIPERARSTHHRCKHCRGWRALQAYTALIHPNQPALQGMVRTRLRSHCCRPATGRTRLGHNTNGAPTEKKRSAAGKCSMDTRFRGFAF